VHANTSGVFKGFYKNSVTGLGQFGGNNRDALTRIKRDLDLPLPIFSNYRVECRVYQGDANQIIREVDEVDLAYIDPPYNQHPYGSNYFMLNLLVDYKRPTTISEVSSIPNDWKRSQYNKRNKILEALADLVQNIRAKFLMISYNSEGFIKRDEMLSMLADVGSTQVLETKYNTFRGSRNLQNRDIHVKEFLFLVEK
jgi:adenine-specific DNA-methyltransferase